MESLKHARKAAGLTLTELGARCGMLPQAIARAERAGIDPKASTVMRIAQALGVPACELLDGEVSHARHRRRRPQARRA